VKEIMVIKTPYEVEPPPLKTSPRRSGGWFRRLQQRIRLALAGDDQELIVENKTRVSWRMYHDYHQLGIIDAGERRIFQIDKHGTLNVRPCADGEDVEYLVLPLSIRVHRVHIYRRSLSAEIEVYDMRVA